jgi:hypothetical protein
VVGEEEEKLSRDKILLRERERERGWNRWYRNASRRNGEK